MSDLDNTFKEKSKTIHIQPSVNAWKTLNKKLDRRKRKKRNSKFINPNSFLLGGIILGLLVICVLYIYPTRWNRSHVKAIPGTADSIAIKPNAKDSVSTTPVPGQHK